MIEYKIIFALFYFINFFLIQTNKANSSDSYYFGKHNNPLTGYFKNNNSTVYFKYIIIQDTIY